MKKPDLLDNLYLGGLVGVTAGAAGYDWRIGALVFGSVLLITVYIVLRGRNGVSG